MASTLQSAVALDLSTQIEAALHGAAVALANSRAFLRITGPDATRWLNGMVTNSIPSLAPGEGNYNFILNAQGRILGDCTIYREPKADAFLLATEASQLKPIHDHLDKFIIMDDVELQPEPSNVQSCSIIGPTAPALVNRYYQWFLRGSHLNLSPLRMLFLGEVSDQLTTLDEKLVPRIEFSMPNAEPVMASLIELGATKVGPQALEALRILEGTPRYGIDIRNTETARDLPQETGQTRALHFAKGCYLGQEIVERIRSRGNVHRTFSGFRLEGNLPAAGTALLAEGKAVGELTSVAAIPLSSGSVQLALGYVRREALDRRVALEYPGGTAVPISLPYEGIS